jgi:major membrane immunogen (membrane-anchored lipoprotein)
MRWLILALLLLSGCGKSDEKVVVVPLDQVPAPALNAAKLKLPDVTFDAARRLPNGIYEITGKTKKGKIFEVEVKPDGQVVAVE